MPRRNATDILAHLGAEERAQVLSEILKNHPDLCEEANAIAENLIHDVSIEEVAEEVAYLITSSVDPDDLYDRAGAHSWGYVEPTEAAWELLEESIADVLDDMKRRFEAGMNLAAEKICQGILLGLHSVEDSDADGVLGWAPDFPAEAAVSSLSLFLELYPQRQRRATGDRIIHALEEQASDWVEMLGRVVDKATSTKPRNGK